MRAERTGRGLAVGQGAFYLAAGIWPLVDEPSGLAAARGWSRSGHGGEGTA